ncbi:MAG TPA: suppressor of fused domain protein [Polyangiaceae bacterium]|nr:suppressor of fused domain protein [Polyangiaceae bacterium]
MSTPRDRLSKFLDHLDAIFETEPEFFPFESRILGAPNLACMVYRDIPEADHVTGVTYGLSEVAHPRWGFGRPELIISVQSTDTAWPLTVAEMANRLRGQCPFSYGDIIDFGQKIAPESEMSAFLVFTPSILAPEAALGIDVGADQPVNIAGMHPLYDSERAVLADMGLEQFWKHPNFDRYDVQRTAITSATHS